MTDELRRQLHDLAASPAASPIDWAAQVHDKVRHRRRTRVAGGAVTLATLVAAGALVTLHGADDSAKELYLVPASPSPATAPPLPSPLPTTPMASPPARLAVAPRTQTSPSPSAPAPVPTPPGPVSSPTPMYDQNPSQVVTLTVTGNRTVTAGDTVRFAASATTEDGQPYIHAARYDGVQEGQESAFSCPVAVPHAKQPAQTTRSFEHVFNEAGVHTVEIRADAACSYYQGRAAQTVRVMVRPAPAASASPTPTPTPSP